jgi:probable HAF family extracellular repeat protein
MFDALAIRIQLLMIHTRPRCGILALSVLLLLPGRSHALSYTITDLGTLGGDQSFTYGMNSGGDVVGQSYTAGRASYRAFLSPSGGAMQNLGTLGGTHSAAFAISDNGYVTGYSYTLNDQFEHAFLLVPGGSMQDLGALGGTYSVGESVNQHGDVVGLANYNDAPAAHAFLSSLGGPMTDLGTLGGANSHAYAINDAGTIVGASSLVGNTSTHAFVIQKGGSMQDLGIAPDKDSVAFNVNSSGDIVGYFGTPAPGYHAFRLAPSAEFEDLGTLGGSTSMAYSSNSQGIVVGTSQTANNADDHAFVFLNGSMLDLNDLVPDDSGWDLLQARSINDDGQIAGYGIDPFGEAHSILLTPTSVPEASSYLAVLFLFVASVHQWIRRVTMQRSAYLQQFTYALRRGAVRRSREGEFCTPTNAPR